MERKLFQLMAMLILPISLSAQAYRVPTFIPAEKSTSTDVSAIFVQSIAPIAGDENGYTIEFCDTQNVNRAVEQYATSFKFYLSYKGKRVSDYRTANSNYKYRFTCTCYAWPGSVPAGYEKYICVQIGEEPSNVKRDRRDDSGAARY